MEEQNNESRGDMVIYQAPDGSVELDVRLEKESIWLNLNQLAKLFDRDKSVVSRHLHNVFQEGELERETTVAKNATVQMGGDRKVTRQVDYYNLDAIISVGYRVNSKRGTQFRIWATQVLRNHVLKGYTVNQSRLQDLNQAVRLVTKTAMRRDLSGDEAKPVYFTSCQCARYENSQRRSSRGRGISQLQAVLIDGVLTARRKARELVTIR